VLEQGLMTQEKLDEALDPKNMLAAHNNYSATEKTK
jgi:hypothetical protein